VSGSGHADGGGESGHDGWSEVAVEWAELWGRFSEPARRILIETAGIGPGTRVLDVGAGSGEFLESLRSVGAVPVGADPAQRMVELARARVPGVPVVVAHAEQLPWADGSFDVVTAVNALQFADDTLDALAEFARVVVPGGSIAVANWAEAARNDIDSIEAALAAEAGEDPGPDGDLRVPGGLETLVADAGLELVAAGLVEVEWRAADEETLVRGILLGEDHEVRQQVAPVVVDAARPFRSDAGGYRLRNAFRYAVARTGSGAVGSAGMRAR
jgi:SAM-dependent methyltransferase